MLPSVSADSSVYPSLPTWHSEESAMSSIFACHDVQKHAVQRAARHAACQHGLTAPTSATPTRLATNAAESTSEMGSAISTTLLAQRQSRAS